eukprot:1046312-Pelagomonas_calceolata.AAC.1
MGVGLQPGRLADRVVAALTHTYTHMHAYIQVDPIVASFCGGSVGVLSALLVVEINNIRKQQRNRCHYCNGTGRSSRVPNMLTKMALKCPTYSSKWL